MGEKQEIEGNYDCLMLFLQDLVQHENERKTEWVESPLHIRFGREDS